MRTLEPGTVLAGKYRVTRVIGEGGMGVVVAAVHMQLDEPVALKFMLPSAMENAEAVARFLREARASVKLKSEHVARVSDVGTLESGAPYIVMEYLQGTDLSDLLSTKGPLPPEVAVDYVIQACDALAEAHSLGIIHRDLKPANLFLTRRHDGSSLVKVLDFGISKSSPLNDASENLTKTGGLMGSPHYMSPEQMKSAKHTDARSDIWSLGVILHELLGGRTPFDADTLGGLLAQVLTESPRPLSVTRPGLPEPLYAAVAKCLEKDRENRWPSIAALATALAPFAPPHALPLIERISGLRAASASAIPVASSDPGRGSLVPSTGRSVPSATAWADTSALPTARSKKPIAVMIGLAVVACAAITATAILRHAPSPSTQTSAAGGAAMVAPPVTAASTPEPPLPPVVRPVLEPATVAVAPAASAPLVPALLPLPTHAPSSGSPGHRHAAIAPSVASATSSASPPHPAPSSTAPPRPAAKSGGDILDTSN